MFHFLSSLSELLLHLLKRHGEDSVHFGKFYTLDIKHIFENCKVKLCTFFFRLTLQVTSCWRSFCCKADHFEGEFVLWPVWVVTSCKLWCDALPCWCRLLPSGFSLLVRACPISIYMTTRIQRFLNRILKCSGCNPSVVWSLYSGNTAVWLLSNAVLIFRWSQSSSKQWDSELMHYF